MDQKCQRRRQKEAEIPQPDPLRALIWPGQPVQWPADRPSFSEPGDNVNEESGRNKREQNQSEKMASPIWITKQEPPEQQERQKEKGMQMEKRHRAIE